MLENQENGLGMIFLILGFDQQNERISVTDPTKADEISPSNLNVTPIEFSHLVTTTSHPILRHFALQVLILAGDETPDAGWDQIIAPNGRQSKEKKL